MHGAGAEAAGIFYSEPESVPELEYFSGVGAGAELERSNLFYRSSLDRVQVAVDWVGLD